MVAGTGRQRAFVASDLIDPTVDDPDEFLLFVSDGTVTPRPGLAAAKEHRARETLRVFQIADSPYLRKARQDAVSPHIVAIDTLLPHGVEVVKGYVQTVIAKIESVPFSTAVKHYLGGLLS